MVLKKFSENPLIHSKLSGLENNLGDNINGPSVIKIPIWIKNPLGKYYMYFSHHNGDFIRVAYADKLDGPWNIYNSGSLKLKDTFATGHIASPDVHIDEKNKKIIMYFHGIGKSVNFPKNDQLTFIAESNDGINFKSKKTTLGPFYFRVFNWNDSYYAIAKCSNRSGAVLLKSKFYNKGFKKIKYLIPRMRHCGLYLEDDILNIFYSRIGDKPETIIMSELNMKTLKLLNTYQILKPDRIYEGSNLPSKRSFPGIRKYILKEVTDPYIFKTDLGRLYLFYSAKGENNICASKLNLNFKKKKLKTNLIQELLFKLYFYDIFRLSHLKKILNYSQKNTFIYSILVNFIILFRELKGKPVRDTLYYKELNIAYISISKVANSAINSVFLNKLNIPFDSKDYHSIHQAKKAFKISNSDFIKLNCYKFAFVRNPFDRLISCYINKVINENHDMQKRYFGLIKKNMSFEEFIKIVCKIPDIFSDTHFKSQYSILYENKKPIINNIFKFENIDHDFNIISKKFNLEKLPHYNKSKVKKIKYSLYYNKDLLNMVYKRYKKDIIYLGYEKEYKKILNEIK